MQGDDGRTYQYISIRAHLSMSASRVDMDYHDYSHGKALTLRSEYPGGKQCRDVVCCKTLDDAKQCAADYINTLPETEVSKFTFVIAELVATTCPSKPAITGNNGQTYEWMVTPLQKTPMGNTDVTTGRSLGTITDLVWGSSPVSGNVLCTSKEQAEETLIKLQKERPDWSFSISKCCTSPAAVVKPDTTFKGDDGATYKYLVIKLSGRPTSPMGLSEGLLDIFDHYHRSDQSVRSAYLASQRVERSLSRAGDIRLSPNETVAKADLQWIAEHTDDTFVDSTMYLLARITHVPELKPDIVRLSGGLPTSGHVVKRWMVSPVNAIDGVSNTFMSNLGSESYTIIDPRPEFSKPAVTWTFEDAQETARKLKRALPPSTCVVISEIHSTVEDALTGKRRRCNTRAV